ncbi:hypothetical protein IAT40_007011 [Kwoniella sp. CBS 6097]
MPRIPVRTTPYHALPRCTRHYKSKRDLILRALGKASFINGSQFVIAWISPKGDTDIFASELLQSAVKDKDGTGGGVLNKKELEKEAQRVKGEMVRRWDEIRRMEEKGEAPTLEDDGAEDGEENDDGAGEELDADRTLVDEGDSPLKAGSSSSSSYLGVSSLKRPSPSANSNSTSNGMYSTFSANNTRSTTPATPMTTVVLKPDQIETFYMDRFTNLQQQTCKLVVKAWIKIIEPKKQMKFPYNKGEDFKPSWWPEGVKHREPDHLPKDERKTLLMSIIRNPSVNVARLQLSTAETSALISASKLAILREIYIVAKEEERMRLAGDSTSDLVVELPIVATPATSGSPEPTTTTTAAAVAEKRSHANAFFSESNKENYDPSKSAYAHAHAPTTTKRQKAHARLPALTISAQLAQPTYDAYTASPSPFAYAQPAQHPHAHAHAHAHLSGHVWRESPSHLSPYPYATSDVHSDYSRSPNPELQEHHQQQQQQQQPRQYQHHLAPILSSHGATPSPIESPAFHSAAMQPSASAPGYFNPRSSAAAYSTMQQQQMEFLHQHQHAAAASQQQQQQQQTEAYGFQSPYITDQAWEGSYQQTA